MKNRGSVRFFPLVLVVLLTSAFASHMLLFPKSAQADSTSCQVSYDIFAQFNSEFGVDLTIKNTGNTTINGWALQFAFPNGQQLTSSQFNANFTQVGANVTAVNRSYDAVIPPGSVVRPDPGFLATWNNVTNNPPASITLNGVTCSVIVIRNK